MSSSASIAARWWSGKESLFPWIPKPGESTSSRGTSAYIVLVNSLIIMCVSVNSETLDPLDLRIER